MAWGQRLSRTARTENKQRTRKTKFTPSLERLESRDVPTTAVLSNGVLTITGTSGNDSIVLSQSNGRVQISGVTSTFATTSINSVVINDGAGSDSVSLS